VNVAHINGEGMGLFWIDEKMQLHKHPASIVGTFTNRYIHNPSNQAFLGPHVIDTKDNVRTIEALKGHRPTATMDHLIDPQNKVYMLAMEGEFYEVDVHTPEARQLFDLVKELDIPKTAQPHFKSAYTDDGRAVVWRTTPATKAIISARRPLDGWPSGTGSGGRFWRRIHLSKSTARTQQALLSAVRSWRLAGTRRPYS
jgi:hypothetical protein